MKNRLLFVPVLLALVVSLAACGGGSQNVPANAIAVVNGTPITLAQFNDFFAQAVTAAKLQGQTTDARNAAVHGAAQPDRRRARPDRRGASSR